MRRTTQKDSGSKGNALWGGKGTTGTRSNGLWGGGSRGAALLVASLLAIFLVTLSSPIAGADNTQAPAYVTPSLLSDAQANPTESFDVIVQGDASRQTSWVAQNVQSDATGLAQQDVSDAQSALQTVQQQASNATNQWHNLQSQASKANQNYSSFAAKLAKKQANAAAVKQAQQDAAQAAAAAAAAQAQATDLDSQVTPLQTAVSQAQTEVSTTDASLDQEQQFTAIPGVHLTLTGRQIVHLANRSGILSIVSNAPVKMSGSVEGLSNDQLWPWVVGDPVSWADDANAANTPTIAVIDSGIDPSSSDLGDRLLGQTDVSTLADNTADGDGYGHGTFVASIAAGSADGHAGADPYAKLYSVDVMDDQGMASISDVVAGCDWVLAHKDEYNIKVANLSLTGTTPASVMFDPLDQAVEQLWLNGIVVVAAAGNYNTDGQPSGVPYAPGNDPFVITVGANDTNSTVDESDDFAAPWSAFGYTLDGFSKPDIGAPGRYMIGAAPAGGGLAAERPDAVVGDGYMELSGTSFAAPVVSGAAAYLLAQHPDWTPDQVKGALMLSAQPTPDAVPGSDGVGELDLAAAAAVTDAPNPNAGLDQYLTTSDQDDSSAFDSAAWNSAATSNAAWASAAWSSAAWSSAAWASAAWSSAAWSSAAWASAAWSSAAWSSAAWASAAWNSAAWNSAAWANNASQDGAIAVPTVADASEATLATELGVKIDGIVATTATTAPAVTPAVTAATTTTAPTTTTTPVDTTAPVTTTVAGA